MRSRLAWALRRLEGLEWEQRLVRRIFSSAAIPNALLSEAAPAAVFAAPSLFHAAAPRWAPHAAHSRCYATAAPGADLAQQILAAADPSNMADLTPALESLEPAGLPAVARAAVVTGATDKAFRAALVDAAVRGLPSLDAGDLCSVVESLAELGAYSVPFKDATADQILARLDEFSGDMLGHALRAFGSMQYYDDELLEGVVSHVGAHLEKFSAENVADVVYALSKCGFCHPDLVPIVRHTGELLLEEAGYDRGEAIASIVDAYSRVGCEDPEVVDALVGKVAEKPHALSGEALSKLVVATVRLGCEDERLLGKLLDAMVQKLDDMSAKAIVKTVAVLGELGMCHTVLLDALTDRAIPARMMEFHSKGLEDLVNSLNKLGYYNQSFLEIMKSREKRG